MRESQQLKWLQQSVVLATSDACIIWPFHTDRDGYGRIKWEGKNRAAHRLAYKLLRGQWPEPCGLHSCDTPSCCNPYHVQAGTHAENQHQKAHRGRSLRGEQQHDAKLTVPEVRRIRQRYIPRVVTYRQLAVEYNVTPALIRHIVTGRIWRHIL